LGSRNFGLLAGDAGARRFADDGAAGAILPPASRLDYRRRSRDGNENSN